MRLLNCIVLLTLCSLVPKKGRCDIVSSFHVISEYVAEPDSGSRTLSFGGVVTDTNGNLINGNCDFRFSVFDSANGGNALFVEDITTTIQNGQLSHQLGANVPFGSSAFAGYNGFNRYLGVSVNGVDVGRIAINNSGVELNGAGVRIQNSSSLSAYISDISNPGNRTLSFGGVVTDTDGNLINGNRDLRFSVFDSANGGNVLFVEDITTTIQNGQLSYQLGTNVPFGSSSFDGYNGFNRYLGVSVNGVDTGRIAINNSGVELNGAGVRIQNSSSLSAYISDISNPGNRTLSFGGVVTDTDGNLVNGNRDLRFSVFDSAIGGNALFVEDITMTIQNGHLSYQLGTNELLRSSVFDGYDGFNRYLGLSVNGVEMERFLLNSSTGFSFTAVPEPSSILLLACVSSMLPFYTRVRSRANNKAMHAEHAIGRF